MFLPILDPPLVLQKGLVTISLSCSDGSGHDITVPSSKGSRHNEILSASNKSGRNMTLSSQGGLDFQLSEEHLVRPSIKSYQVQMHRHKTACHSLHTQDEAVCMRICCNDVSWTCGGNSIVSQGRSGNL